MKRENDESSKNYSIVLPRLSLEKEVIVRIKEIVNKKHYPTAAATTKHDKTRTGTPTHPSIYEY
jgi:hypothetical protein